jgi:hypothetical protein
MGAWPKIRIPLAAGRGGGADPKSLPTTRLSSLINGRVSDELGAVTKRAGSARYDATASAVALSNPLGVYTSGQELVLHATGTDATTPKLYSRDRLNNTWSNPLTFQRCRVTQNQIAGFMGEPSTAGSFATTMYGIIQCDRARSGNLDLVAWTQRDSSAGLTVYYLLRDAATGAQIGARGQMSANTRWARCVAVGAYVHIYYYTSVPSLRCRVISATTGTQVADTLITADIAASATANFDVVSRNGSAVVSWGRTGANGFHVARIVAATGVASKFAASRPTSAPTAGWAWRFATTTRGR